MKTTTSNPKKIKKTELVVGIPSYNEADNIAFVAEQADIGLKKYFPDFKSVIINVDNNSPDNTKKAFLSAKTKTPKIYASTPAGIAGKGYNFYNLFNKVSGLNARGVAVVDADLRSITPEWIYELLNPIVKHGYDFATPYYSRSEYDGSITNHICYPLIFGLLGYNIRQPIGGDFSFSSKLSNTWIKKKWHKTTFKYGIDIFMTLNAVLGDFNIAQVGLGAKIHKPSAPKLGPMFSQVLTTLFKNIKSNKKAWIHLKEHNKVDSIMNFELAKPQTIGVDYKGMKTTAFFGFKTNKDIIKRIVSPQIFKKLDKMFAQSKLEISKNMWYKIVYDYIYAFDTTDMNAGLIEALKPLYFARYVSFFKETMEKSYTDSEKEILNQAELFWNNRDYLLKKYR